MERLPKKVLEYVFMGEMTIEQQNAFHIWIKGYTGHFPHWEHNKQYVIPYEVYECFCRNVEDNFLLEKLREVMKIM